MRRHAFLSTTPDVCLPYQGRHVPPPRIAARFPPPRPWFGSAVERVAAAFPLRAVVGTLLSTLFSPPPLLPVPVLHPPRPTTPAHSPVVDLPPFPHGCPHPSLWFDWRPMVGHPPYTSPHPTPTPHLPTPISPPFHPTPPLPHHRQFPTLPLPRTLRFPFPTPPRTLLTPHTFPHAPLPTLCHTWLCPTPSPHRPPTHTQFPHHTLHTNWTYCSCPFPTTGPTPHTPYGFVPHPICRNLTCGHTTHHTLRTFTHTQDICYNTTHTRLPSRTHTQDTHFAVHHSDAGFTTSPPPPGHTTHTGHGYALSVTIFPPTQDPTPPIAFPTWFAPTPRPHHPPPPPPPGTALPHPPPHPAGL